MLITSLQLPMTFDRWKEWSWQFFNLSSLTISPTYTVLTTLASKAASSWLNRVNYLFQHTMLFLSSSTLESSVCVSDLNNFFYEFWDRKGVRWHPMVSRTIYGSLFRHDAWWYLRDFMCARIESNLWHAGQVPYLLYYSSSPNWAGFFTTSLRNSMPSLNYLPSFFSSTIHIYALPDSHDHRQ